MAWSPTRRTAGRRGRNRRSPTLARSLDFGRARAMTSTRSQALSPIRGMAVGHGSVNSFRRLNRSTRFGAMVRETSTLLVRTGPFIAASDSSGGDRHRVHWRSGIRLVIQSNLDGAVALLFDDEVAPEGLEAGGRPVTAGGGERSPAEAHDDHVRNVGVARIFVVVARDE